MILLALLKKKTRVLFVCTENICRSPLAEGVLRHYTRLAGRNSVLSASSAGTRASQPGARPDQRARRIALNAGIDLGRIRARRVTENDLIDSDLILAMDRTHLRYLKEMCPLEHQQKISLLLSYDPGQAGEDVPDPYYGSYDGFLAVFRIIDKAVASLMTHIGSSGA